MSIEFELTVQVQADEWAYNQRRLAYLETLLVSIARDTAQVQEWFSAAELAALRLPGMPRKATGLAQKARRERWPIRRVGRHTLYHITCLPGRAFDTLISRLLDLPTTDDIEASVPLVVLTAPPPEPALLETANTAPPWVLPLMRLMRGPAKGNLFRAWRDLPQHLPKGTVLPTADEAAHILVDLGLSDKLANWSEH